MLDLAFCLLIANPPTHNTKFWQRLMVVVIGKIHLFRPGQNDWTMCVECLGHLFVANGITTAEKKVCYSVIHDWRWYLQGTLQSTIS